MPDDDDLPFTGGLERGLQQADIVARLGDNVIGGKHAHHGVGIERRRICAARPIAGAVLRCAGSARIWRRHFRKLRDDFRAQMMIGQNPDALGRKHRPQPIDGLLDE